MPGRHTDWLNEEHNLYSTLLDSPATNRFNHQVIITEWVEGTRLADTQTSDVKNLCSTLLNCYLIQLLETGLLHADPHPGNLMRTPDGKIVILDFGLMTEVRLSLSVLSKLSGFSRCSVSVFVAILILHCI